MFCVCSAFDCMQAFGWVLEWNCVNTRILMPSYPKCIHKLGKLIICEKITYLYRSDGQCRDGKSGEQVILKDKSPKCPGELKLKVVYPQTELTAESQIKTTEIHSHSGSTEGHILHKFLQHFKQHT